MLQSYFLFYKKLSGLFFARISATIFSMNSLEMIISYLAIINIISFLTMGSDKRRAKKHAFRIPESVLFILAIMGGSFGSVTGMYTFRHKTKHWYFVVFMPLILIIQIAIVILLYKSPIDISFR